jgi:quercetin dioxygenase-like cupin family protein
MIYSDEQISEDEKIRTFDVNVDDEELVWHRDMRDREVTVLSGVGWTLQMDDELPYMLFEGDTVVIPKLTYHRLLKGNDTLIVRIVER